MTSSYIHEKSSVDAAVIVPTSSFKRDGTWQDSLESFARSRESQKYNPRYLKLVKL